MVSCVAVSAASTLALVIFYFLQKKKELQKRRTCFLEEQIPYYK
jgi:uncharacterized protein HemX